MIPIQNTVRDMLKRTRLRAAVMAYRHRGLRGEDVFLASYPRSGNTWIKSLICSCISGEAMTNFSDTVDPLIPIVGYHRNVRPMLGGNGRLIKTHEVYRREYQKAIWIVRDPRDVVISEYRLALRAKRISGSLDKYVECFVGFPKSAGANWGQHTLSWLDSPIAESPSMLSLQFDELQQEPEKSLDRILQFLNLPTSPQVIRRAISQNGIESMAARHSQYDKSLGNTIATGIPAVNSGKSGGWKEILSQSALDTIHKAFDEAMRRTGFSS